MSSIPACLGSSSSSSAPEEEDEGEEGDRARLFPIPNARASASDARRLEKRTSGEVQAEPKKASPAIDVDAGVIDGGLGS